MSVMMFYISAVYFHLIFSMIQQEQSTDTNLNSSHPKKLNYMPPSYLITHFPWIQGMKGFIFRAQIQCVLKKTPLENLK